MSNEREDLARRAVACKGWRWLPGMLDSDGWRYSGESEGAHWWWHSEEHQGELPLEQVMGTPDLSDPATLGCLLALVREAFPEAPTEAEALVAALEAAP